MKVWLVEMRRLVVADNPDEARHRAMEAVTDNRDVVIMSVQKVADK